MIPLKYKEIKEQSESLLIKTYFKDDLFNPSIAFTTNRTNNLCGTVYKVYVNDKDKDLSRFLELHELGHIIFGHVKNEEERMDKYLLSKITIAYAKVQKYFPNYEMYLNVFRTLIFNVVMDFQVNSTLFNEEEWKYMNEKTSELLGCKNCRGMHPEDYGYPSGLHWNQYLTMIIMDPEKFMKQFRREINQNLKEQFMSGPVTLEEYEKVKAAREAMEKDSPFTAQELEELKGRSKDHNEASFKAANKKGKGLQNGNYVIDVSSLSRYYDMESLSELLIKKRNIKKQDSRTKRDLLYNYNRRKYSTQVIIPKNTNFQVKIPGRLVILMDVSSSVDLAKIACFAETFRKFKDNYRETYFITWNVGLVAEWKISDPPVGKAGGGTCMADGILYAAEKYQLKSQDTFFLISDFCDDLPEWREPLARLPCHKYAVNWDNDRIAENPGFSQIFQYQEQKNRK